MVNPFDAPDGVFSVLVNENGHYSLWPSGFTFPSGWRVVHADDTRAACLDYVERAAARR